MAASSRSTTGVMSLGPWRVLCRMLLTADARMLPLCRVPEFREFRGQYAESSGEFRGQYT